MRSPERMLLLVTNIYAGNFEREMCAYCTGIVGWDDATGIGLVDPVIKAIFEDKIKQEPDEHGTHRPAEISFNDADIEWLSIRVSSDNEELGPSSVIIYIKEDAELTDVELELIDKRAKEFFNDSPYKYLDENGKYFGYVMIDSNRKRLITRSTFKGYKIEGAK